MARRAAPPQLSATDSIASLLELPIELQLRVAGLIESPCDRVALSLAVPPLGLEAAWSMKEYKGLEMEVELALLANGMRVDEAFLRRYVRDRRATYTTGAPTRTSSRAPRGRSPTYPT